LPRASVKQAVLEELGGIPDLQSLVPSGFLQRFGLAAPTQYGTVCQDVRGGLGRLERCGAGPFLYADTRPPGWTERGERRPVRTPMALGYVDHQQIELLGPGENTDFYREKVPSDGSFALHHVGIAQPGLAGARRALEQAGFPPVVEIGMRIGPLYTVDVVYFETRDELGFYLEILQFKAFGRHAPLTEGLVSTIGRLQRRFRSTQSKQGRN
jgi:hypothetical protein